jgi:hypothetical protein
MAFFGILRINLLFPASLDDAEPGLLSPTLTRHLAPLLNACGGA